MKTGALGARFLLFVIQRGGGVEVFARTEATVDWWEKSHPACCSQMPNGTAVVANVRNALGAPASEPLGAPASGGESIYTF
jgi:hypothetical protein